MKKILKMMLIALLMSNIVSLKVFADDDIPTADEVRQILLEHGIPATYVGNAIEHLQKIEVEDEHFESILSKIDEAERLLDGASDISLVDEETKTVIKDIASESAGIVGLNVSFNNDAQGVTTLTLNDPNGNTIVSANTFHMLDLVQNVDLNKIAKHVTQIVKFANDSGRDKFEPIQGEFNNTGNNFRNYLLGGFGLIILSGITFVLSRKVFVI